MYRGMSHGRPVVNGYSGWVPPHYVQVQADLRNGLREVAGGLARRAIDGCA